MPAMNECEEGARVVSPNGFASQIGNCFGNNDYSLAVAPL